jgi:hypothetical protein
VKQGVIHASKMNALKTNSLKPSNFEPFDQSNITSLDQKQNKNFSTLMQTYP